MGMILKALISAVLESLTGFLVKIATSIFTRNRDEKIGSLEAINKQNAGALNDIEKADAARNDPVYLDSVRAKYSRD